MSDDQKLLRIEDKVDKIQENISHINVTLAKQHESLKEHIKRTNLLEKKMDPVEKHVHSVNTLLKLIGFFAVLVGILEGVVKISHG